MAERTIRLHQISLPLPNLVYSPHQVHFPTLSLSVIPSFPRRSTRGNATGVVQTSFDVQQEHVKNRNSNQKRPQQTSFTTSGQAFYSGATDFAHECSTTNGNTFVYLS